MIRVGQLLDEQLNHWVAIGLNLDALAAFLAWWMPVNLVGWLVCLGVISGWLGGRWASCVFSLAWTLAMTLLFWPGLLLLSGWVMGSAYLDAQRDRRRRRAARQALARGEAAVDVYTTYLSRGSR